MGLLGSFVAGVKGVGGAILQRVERFDEDRVLRMHRRRLEKALKTKPRRPWPIRGELTPSGFVQKTGGRQVYLLGIFGVVVTAGFLWLLRNAVIGISLPGWSPVMLVATGIFGAIIGWLVWAFAKDRKGLAAVFIRGELTVERWPLRTGETCAVRYRASARGRRAIVKARAVLRCEEAISWEDSSRKHSDGRSLGVHTASLVETTPTTEADGALSVTWKMQVPAGAPPSLDGENTTIAWEIVVDVQAAGAVAATQQFPVLVIPGAA